MEDVNGKRWFLSRTTFFRLVASEIDTIDSGVRIEGLLCCFARFEDGW